MCVRVFYFLWVGVCTLWAHPHLFIEPTVELMVKGDQWTQIRVRWEWDSMWSETVLDACDSHRDLKFSASENECVYNGYFQNLHRFHWFLTVKLQGKPLSLPPVRDFQVSVTPNKKLVYQFDFLISKPLKHSNPLLIRFEDETTYVAFDSRIWLIPPEGYSVKNPKVQVSGFYGVQAEIDLLTP